MEIKDIKDLIITLNSTDIESLEIEKVDFKLSLSKGKSNNQGYSHEEAVVRQVDQTSQDQVQAQLSPADESLYSIKSPMVGVYYERPSPESSPFVKLGDQVEEGQSLCIVEAMKIMNEIESEVSGEIVEILVSDGDTIEYGQDLMRIRRN